MLITITLLKNCNKLSLHFLKILSKASSLFFKISSPILNQIARFFLIHLPQAKINNCFDESLQKTSRSWTVMHRLNNGIWLILTVEATSSQDSFSIQLPVPQTTSVFGFGIVNHRDQQLSSTQGTFSNFTIARTMLGFRKVFECR